MNKDVPDLWTPFSKDERIARVPANGTPVLGMFAVRQQNKDKTWSDWSKFPNGATTLGLNYLLNTGFRATSQSANWYIGLISETSYSALSAADTSASHAGWVELTTYTSATRIAWSPGAAASGSVTISSALTFTTNADSNIRGAFLANSSTKSSTTDLIYGTGVEAAARSILSGLTYQLYYTVTLVPS